MEVEEEQTIVYVGYVAKSWVTQLWRKISGERLQVTGPHSVLHDLLRTVDSALSQDFALDLVTWVGTHILTVYDSVQKEGHSDTERPTACRGINF